MGKSPRPIRTVSGSGPTKSEAILLRLEPGEKEGFKAAAELAGIDLSAWMRERLRRVARQELEEANLPIPFIRLPKMD